MKNLDVIRFIPLDLMHPDAAPRRYDRLVVFEPRTGLDGAVPGMLAQPRSGDVSQHGIHYFLSPADALDQQGVSVGGVVGLIEPDSANKERSSYGLADKIRVTEVRLYCMNDSRSHTNSRLSTFVPSPSSEHRREQLRGILVRDRRTGRLVPHCVTDPDQNDKVGGIPKQDLVVSHTFHQGSEGVVFSRFIAA